MIKSNIKIIAGKHRGKKLYMADKTTTRSSKNILKESVFNTLQFEVADSIWVEVFAGTGSIGLEALSRGAKGAYFLEQDEEAFRVLKKNITHCGEDDNAYPIFGDSFENIYDVIDMLKKNKQKAFFYFDPPFSIRDGYEDVYNKVIDTIARLPKNNVEKIIIEHQSSISFPDNIAKYTKLKTKKFGKSSVSYYA
ncbi:MAG: 16S rRNA (guanine(966)-N(2))-methyltransferase RsmD [Epsilonproteobacteria bacterium]|nr:16S rRNA (guanine(966)-N(2))-methyltransferase RsmD [Campylobacterota bacterium]